MNSATASSVPASWRALLEGLIDYAGLFPPAALTMPLAARAYAAYRQGSDAWALGRFVVPAERIDELADAVRRAGGTAGGVSWPLSVLVSWPFPPDFASRFVAATSWGASIDAFEVKANATADVASVRAALPRTIDLFVEPPAGSDVVRFARAAADAGCGLKLRTGATNVDGFPAPNTVADFVEACVSAGVPFKATAGLHHPLRASHPVTYEPGAPCATMHGFVNLFLGAALLAAGIITRELLQELLEERSPEAFAFGEDTASWRGFSVDSEQIRAARRLARGFGSCSFEEPLADLRGLAWLPPATPHAV